MTINEKINYFVDQFEELMKLTYDKKSKNYFECFTYITKIILDEQELDLELEEDEHQQFLDLIANITNLELETPYLRQALFMSDITGWKHSGYNLDAITPEVVGVLINYLINHNKYGYHTLLDPNMGCGNLLFSVYLQTSAEASLLGVENDVNIARYVGNKADLLGIDLTIYQQDFLQTQLANFDLVVSDLAIYDYQNDNYHSNLYDQGVRYSPYLTIEKVVNSLDDQGIMIVVVATDFFTRGDASLFRQAIMPLLSKQILVTLPPNIFRNDLAMRSLYIIKKAASDDEVSKPSTECYVLPVTTNQVALKDVLNKIKF